MTKPIPDNILIEAINATLMKYRGHCVDNWGEEESVYCRKLCGDRFQYVETDWIRKTAINHRKAGRLISVNGGPKRKAQQDPEGEYRKYLKSDNWLEFRAKILALFNGSCSLCKSKPAEVYHNTFIRIGHEETSDCVVLCRDCRTRVHSLMPDGNIEMNSDPGKLF